MGTERFYKLGSFYRICDRTGFAVRSYNTQKEWQNLVVDKRVFEQRHPQDFVKGVNDDQTVPNGRPRLPNPALGTSLTAQFQVFGDLPAKVTFEAQSGKINIFKAAVIVTPSSYPSSF